MLYDVHFPEAARRRAAENPRPAVYDCFLFSNELDILEIRLHELNSVVDYFVLCESEETFRGAQKPTLDAIAGHRFDAFKEKIIRITIKKFSDATPQQLKKPGFLKWYRQRAQRDLLIEGLKYSQKQDWIMLSDVDEIPRAGIVKSIATDQVYDRCVMMFEHSFYSTKLNWLVAKMKKPWVGTRMVQRRFLRSFQKLRDLRHEAHKSAPIPWLSWRTRLITDLASITFPQRLPESGWHFHGILSPEELHKKIRSMSGSQMSAWKGVDNIEEEIQRRVDRGQDYLGREITRCRLSDLPAQVQDNIDLYRAFIDEG